jgi:thymidylate kinase
MPVNPSARPTDPPTAPQDEEALSPAVGGLRRAITALAGAGVPFAFRGPQPVDAPPPGGDVDILVDRRDLRRTDRVLRGAGLNFLATAGEQGHRFYLALEGGNWLKLDVNVVPSKLRYDLFARDETSQQLHAAYRVGTKGRPGGLTGLRIRARRRLPAALRRSGPVVSILGPDGVGKGSVIAELRGRLPIAVSVRYLGERPVRAADDDRAARDPARYVPPSGLLGELREAQHLLRKGVRTVGRVLREVYLPAWRGDVVLCDRYPIEVLAVRPPRTRLGSLVERLMAEHLIPWPDAIVVLDAPGEVLLERKQEHPLEVLERWRAGYREAFASRGAKIVPTDEPLDRTVIAVSSIVWEALAARRGW